MNKFINQIYKDILSIQLGFLESLKENQFIQFRSHPNTIYLYSVFCTFFTKMSKW